MSNYNYKEGTIYIGTITKDLHNAYQIKDPNEYKTNVWIDTVVANHKELGALTIFSADKNAYGGKQLYKLPEPNNFGIFKILTPLHEPSGKLNVGRQIKLQLLEMMNLDQTVEYVIGAIETWSNPNNFYPEFTSLMLSINVQLYYILPLLTPQKRLQLLDTIHEIVIRSEHDPSIKKPVRRKKQAPMLRNTLNNTCSNILLHTLGSCIAYELLLSKTDEEIHGLEKYFYEKAIQLNYCYDSLDKYIRPEITTSQVAFSRINYFLRKEKDTEYNFFNAPSDTWTPENKHRFASTINLAAFMARRAIAYGYGNDTDRKIVEEYKEYCSIIHRTTKVFEDNYSIKYDDNKNLLIPESADTYDIKEAMKKLDALSQKTTWPAMKYHCYMQLILVSKLKAAAHYVKEKDELAQKESPTFVSHDLISPLRRWKHRKLEQAAFLITALICIAAVGIFSYFFVTDIDFRISIQIWPKRFMMASIIFGVIYLFSFGYGYQCYYPYYYYGYHRYHHWY